MISYHDLLLNGFLVVILRFLEEIMYAFDCASDVFDRHPAASRRSGAVALWSLVLRRACLVPDEPSGKYQ